MIRLIVNPEHPEPRKIAQAESALERGSVIAYPTDTVYALGCDFTIERPEAARLLFLPQKPYLPIDTLRAVLTYPEIRDDVSDAMLVEALETCALPQLVGRLNERSGQEQVKHGGDPSGEAGSSVRPG